ncbi:hypothetical protein K466DRAFT_592214, partial [Polyporus arcularius HHB13444]
MWVAPEHTQAQARSLSARSQRPLSTLCALSSVPSATLALRRVHLFHEPCRGQTSTAAPVARLTAPSSALLQTPPCTLKCAPPPFTSPPERVCARSLGRYAFFPSSLEAARTSSPY